MNISVDILKAFFQMGGYASYVWSAYGLVVITLGVNIISARRYFKWVIKQAQPR